MTETIRYSLLGAQDVKFGTGTFEVTLADGRVVVLEAVNASHIPSATVVDDAGTMPASVESILQDIKRARRGMLRLLDFDQDDATTTGLTWGYRQGMASDGTGIVVKGTVTLTANATNYVEWDPETSAMSVSTSGFTPADKVPIRKLVTNATGVTTNTDVRPIWRQNRTLQHGQCQLARTNATTLTLSPKEGNRLLIAGEEQTIPAAGVTLSNSGLSVSTAYYIYAYMNSSTMTLEASTTAYATDSDSGVTIKSGDATRTLVGLIRTTAGGEFADSDTQLFTLSYFNRRTKHGVNNFTTDRTTTSNTLTEINSEIRVEFLTWADEAALYLLTGAASNSSAGDNAFAAIGIDGVSTLIATARILADTASNVSQYACAGASQPSEGYHYATVGGRRSSAGTVTYIASLTAGGAVLTVAVRG